MLFTKVCDIYKQKAENGEVYIIDKKGDCHRLVLRLCHSFIMVLNILYASPVRCILGLLINMVITW